MRVNSEKYVIQVTKYPTKKSAYETIRETDTMNQALFWWSCYNIGRGYKARMMYKGRTILRKE